MEESYKKIDSRKAIICSTIIFIVYMTAVMFLCLARFSGSGIDINLDDYFLGIRLDRIVHFSMFFPFPFICWLFFKYSSTRLQQNKKFRYAAIILAGVVFAAIAESSQELFTTYRDSDPFDFCANITGILTGCIILFLAEKQLHKIFHKLFKI